MSLTRLRQQGGAVVITIPSDVAALMGWSVGSQLDVEASGDTISIKPVKRAARGRKTITELLEGIDRQEMAEFNEMMRDDLASLPKGKEVI
ncbi:antitoxin [Salmonella enterica subsp. enterica]|uniref:AbrB/MazE/SpoVT family DNA-binding domain-containing protein n=1 Tax=Salmonella enterica TaxID=28901 RepID=UPI0012D055E9|nr:AbrB/MazE/SpoVT family DNA-binding domain-containing protein [Salmonella enterica]EDU8906373.1 antitoxin [Salmonella enterica subsp. enterica]EDV0415269.1 antitoxin [Salmonella enterica subsp. enterica serovar Glostrup]EED3638269.1 antitoxin [Salmonella enterica subsp. enterica serovar Sundsvall]EAP3911081.1 antitoxin [Salmonella enterica]EAP4214752.1 antitoxin [Salmonella enterica subsp. enterica serovar Pomona]